MQDQDKSKLGRRDFLRVMGLGAGVAAAAAQFIATTATEAAAAESMTEAKKARYNPNSEHVKEFYRVNRY
jgi:ribulose kinase